MSSIDTYSGLAAFVTDHLELDDDTVAQLPNLIRLAELKLNRSIIPATREVEATTATVADTQTVAVPSDFRQIRVLSLDGEYPLSPASLTTVKAYGDETGKPLVYAVSGGALYLGPTPDDDYTLSMVYVADISPLTDTNTTNWLMTENPDAYVYGVLAEAEAFRGNLDAARVWEAQLVTVIAEINRQGLRYRNSAPIRLRSPVVV